MMEGQRTVFLAVLLTLSTFSLASVDSPGVSDEALAADVLSWLEPPAAYGGFEVYRNIELVPKSDRWDIGDTLSAQSAAKTCLSGTALLVSDLCAMGHLTKDAAMVASWLLDHVAHERFGQAAASAPHDKKDLRIGAHAAPPLKYVIFSNNCMTKILANSARIDKRAPLFHHVLQHWFAPVFTDMTFAQRTAAVADAGALTQFAATSPVTLAPLGNLTSGHVEIVFAEDLKDIKSSAPGQRLCYEAVAKRGAERWRWFRSREHAYWFRQRLWRYFGIRPAQTFANGVCRLNVTVLERDEDRHFGEQRVGKMLRERLSREPMLLTGLTTLSCTVSVRVVKFDRFKGSSAAPPPHPEQLRILAEETDLLLAAHGAGLAALVAMRPGTAAIEFFPHNFRYFMYEELARLAGVQYFAFESPVVHPPRCCSARGSDVTPVLKRPHDGNGVGARACKKCDIRITDDELTELVLTALETVAVTRAAASATH